MNRTVVWMVCPLVAVACLAQSTVPTQPLIADGGTRQLLVSIFIPDIPNAPFSATVNTEWVRLLSDGTRITLINHRSIARDSAGRIFQERRMLVPQNSNAPSLIFRTEITDPTLKQQYTCFPKKKTCQLDVHEFFAQDVQTTAGNGAGEPLGTQTIGGLETTGTRETTVIQAGAIGNDSLIKITREFWFAPKLGMNLISLRDDPRSGTQRFELSDIVLGQPDAKLFSPPEGSRIVDLRKTSEPEASSQPQN